MSGLGIKLESDKGFNENGNWGYGGTSSEDEEGVSDKFDFVDKRDQSLFKSIDTLLMVLYTLVG